MDARGIEVAISFTQNFLDAASAAITSHRPLLESLREINVKFLVALQEAAKDPTFRDGPDLGGMAPHFKSLCRDTIHRVSRFPFLLIDLGLSEIHPSATPTSLLKRLNEVRDQESSLPLLRTEHIALARSALVLGWHAARTDVGATLLLFGFAPTVAVEMAALALHEVESLAPSCVTPLRLRWKHQPQLWQQILTPAAYSSVDTVRGFVMHAVQLTATTHLK